MNEMVNTHKKDNRSLPTSKSNSIVMLLEDDAHTNALLDEFLVEKGFAVHACHSIYEANNTWDEYNKEISYIITDLCMSPRGLPEDKQKASIGGLLTGWIWVWLNVAKKNPQQYSKLKKIIFLTAYYQNLKEHIDDASHEQQIFFDHYVTCLSKGDVDNVTDRLICTLTRHERLL